MAHKMFHTETMFWDAQSTAAWAQGNEDSTAIDLGGADGWAVDQYRPPEAIIKFSGLASSGSATLVILLLDCDTSGGSYVAVTPIDPTSAAIDFDDALLSDDVRFQIPYGTRQFVKIRVTIGAADLTGGSVTAGLVK